MMKRGISLQNALASLPYNRRTLYIHAVQSLLFNRFVNARIAMGFQLIPGDLVCGIHLSSV